MTMPHWETLSPKDDPAPVAAIALGPDGLWAGGLGGVSWYSDRDGWTPPPSTIALHIVTSLVYADGCLLAGHESGIARSTDNGKSWSETAVANGPATITALALSPTFPNDGVVLAATFGNGILRSSDGGRSWKSSNFGLDEHEVMTLEWIEKDSVLAGTNSGLFHSSNAGRAWRVVPDTAGISFSALALLPDGGMLAAPALGRPLRFSPNLKDWQPVETLSEGIQTWALATLSDGTILVGSGNLGLWSSSDLAQGWSQVWEREIWCLANGDSRVFAGTNTGLAFGDESARNWALLPPPPIHQLQWLLPLEDFIVLAGVHSPRAMCFSNADWGYDDTLADPTTGIAKTSASSYIAATSNGLYLYSNGIDWHRVSEESNCIMATFFREDGWVGISSDNNLLRTLDGGQTWTSSRSPFGNLPMVALQAFPDLNSGDFGYLMAATYDEHRQAVKVWRSDDGERWTPGADSYTPWPQVATLGDPAVFTVGSVISTRQPDGTWHQGAVGETPFRRIAFDGSALFALANDAIWRSDDIGNSWTRDDDGLPIDEILDIAIFEGKLCVLLTGGRLLAKVQ